MSNTGLFAAPPSISTKAEFDRLTEERSRLAPEMHLRPVGPEVADVQERLSRLRESRMGDIHERLQAARNGLETNHAFARLTGKAKGDFGHSR